MNQGKDGFGGKPGGEFEGKSGDGQGGKGEELRDKLAEEYGDKTDFGAGGKDESLREKLEHLYDPDETPSGDKGSDETSPFFGKGEGKEGFGGAGQGEDKFAGSKGQFGGDSAGEGPEFDKGGIDGDKGGGRY